MPPYSRWIQVAENNRSIPSPDRSILAKLSLTPQCTRPLSRTSTRSAVTAGSTTTAFGTIGIAWTIIIGIYGMNFVGMPELSWHYGYLWALGLMVTSGLVLTVLFRRHGWL